MMSLGNALLRGRDVEADPEAGIVWLRKAAETGNWWAVTDMGNLHAEGWEGRAVDLERAAVWKRRLALVDDPAALGWLAYHGE